MRLENPLVRHADRSHRTNQTLRTVAYRGDTMIEVLFAIAVFALVSVLSIIVMNSGVATIEATLELSMARNEIDAQSEALRFIHNSYLSEREFVTQDYKALWDRLSSLAEANDSSDILALSPTNGCSVRYEGSGSESIYGKNAFVINTRNIDKSNVNSTIRVAQLNNSSNIFASTPLNPRLIYGSGSSDTDVNLTSASTNLTSAEGIWIIPVSSTKKYNGVAEFYDFHIYTCWYAPGRTVPTTIGTIMRLYDPELVEAG